MSRLLCRVRQCVRQAGPYYRVIPLLKVLTHVPIPFSWPIQVLESHEVQASATTFIESVVCNSLINIQKVRGGQVQRCTMLLFTLQCYHRIEILFVDYPVLSVLVSLYFIIKGVAPWAYSDVRAQASECSPEMGEVEYTLRASCQCRRPNRRRVRVRDSHFLAILLSS